MSGRTERAPRSCACNHVDVMSQDTKSVDEVSYLPPTTMLSHRPSFNLFKSIRVARAAATRYSSTRYYSSTMHDNDPEILELEKQRNLSNIQHRTSTPHAYSPGWNEHLASVSEAVIKADRSTGSTSDLQRQTVDYLHSRHSPEDRLDTTEASYSHDEVTGPLSGAIGSESDENIVVTRTFVHEKTTEEWKRKPGQTPSEKNVKADQEDV